MTAIVRVPFLGTNDIECELVAWTTEDGGRVVRGAHVCTVETTKTVLDVEAPEDGVVQRLAQVGDRLPVGAVLAVVSAEKLDDPGSVVASLESGVQAADTRRITKKAEILLKRHGVPTEEVLRFAAGQAVTEQVVGRYLAGREARSRRQGLTHLERVGVIGGVRGGGAMIVVESLRRQTQMLPVAVFDRDSAYHDRQVLGVPVVGSSELAEQWVRENRIDSVVIAFNRDLDERARTFDVLKAAGVRFCNVVDPTATLRDGVKLGEGNVILARAYVGACSELGDDNFISGGVWLEHGNRLGSHCGFGPGVFTSGNVQIGDVVRFGTGIYVEPDLTIGDRSVIASGSVITADVPPDSVVRVHYNLHIRPRR
jgi:sugar O-acyltransferase (sialic acid O-acetyltransferase NeuD family)